MLALLGVILASHFLKDMLGAPEVCSKIQDEGLESGRIHQVGQGVFVGFDFLVGDSEHGVSPVNVCSKRRESRAGDANKEVLRRV